jgi:hypothetical protein
LLLMLTSVHFNNEMPFQADEVGYIGAYRVLPTELELLQIPLP